MADPREWIEKADALLASVRYAELVQAGVLLPDDRWLPVITYPPITMYPPQEPETLLATAEEWRGDRPRALYAHIPFCRFCCHYCHWVKRINPSREEVDRYADLLIREADVVRGWLGVEKLRASSILFGGGTPTLLDAAQLDSLLSRFLERVDLSGCRQFSFEAEPASILGEQGAAKLAVLKAHGVDRISIGVQSFEDHVLRGMGRSHDGAEALASIEAVRRAGIGSVSIDLIYGCKDQTIEDWLRSLDTAVASGADAWQLYRLRIERHGDMQGKVLDQFRDGRDRFADLHTVRRMKALGVVRSIESGRQEHFTRIFATAQAHVTQYMWDYCCDLADVIGLGASSWSNYGRTFLLNIADIDAWAARVEEGRVPVDRGLHRDLETDARRSLISPLKNDRVRKERFQARLGFDAGEHFGPEIARLRDLDLLSEDDTSIRLTPRGRFIADETVMQFFQRPFLPYPELAHALTPG